MVGQERLCKATFEIRKSKSELKAQARENWACWRLILSEFGFDYNTVFCQMTPNQIAEANIALDIYEEEVKKSMKKK